MGNQSLLGMEITIREKEMTATQSQIGDKLWSSPYDEYKNLWKDKTTIQIQKEIKSWRSYMQKHNSAYNLHGGNMTAPGQLADGDKLSALRDILKDRGIEE